MHYRTQTPSPLGGLTLASDGEALTGLWLPGQKYFGATLKNDAVERADLPVFAQARAWLEAYFAGRRPDPRQLPLAPQGSAFRKRVWAVLLDIPYGETVTYGQIAREIGCASAQAAGGAVGHNPISIIVPCHRVLGARGDLTGYAGGLQAKRFLLRLEGVLAPDSGL